MWVKGNALIVAGVQGTQPKVSPPPFCPLLGRVQKREYLAVFASLLRTPVIASVAKQSPAWNKYSNYCFLSLEIAALVSLARNDGIDPNSSDYPQ